MSSPANSSSLHSSKISRRRFVVLSSSPFIYSIFGGGLFGQTQSGVPDFAGASVAAHVDRLSTAVPWARNLGFGGAIPKMPPSIAREFFHAQQVVTSDLAALLSPEVRLPADLIGTAQAGLPVAGVQNAIQRLFDNQWQVNLNSAAGMLTQRLSLGGSASSALLQRAQEDITILDLDEVARRLPPKFGELLNTLGSHTTFDSAISGMVKAFSDTVGHDPKVSGVFSASTSLGVVTQIVSQLVPGSAGQAIAKAAPFVNAALTFFKAGPLIGMGPIGIGIAVFGLFKRFCGGRGQGQDQSQALLRQLGPQLATISRQLDAIQKNQELMVGKLNQIIGVLGDLSDQARVLETNIQNIAFFELAQSQATDIQTICDPISRFWSAVASRDVRSREVTEMLSHCSAVAASGGTAARPALNGSGFTFGWLHDQIAANLFTLDGLIGASGRFLSEAGLTSPALTAATKTPNPRWWAYAAHNFVTVSAWASTQQGSQSGIANLAGGFTDDLDRIIDAGNGINKLVEDIASQETVQALSVTINKSWGVSDPSQNSIIRVSDETVRAEWQSWRLPAIGSTRRVPDNTQPSMGRADSPNIYFYDIAQQTWRHLSEGKAFNPFKVAKKHGALTETNMGDSRWLETGVRNAIGDAVAAAQLPPTVAARVTGRVQASVTTNGRRAKCIIYKYEREGSTYALAICVRLHPTGHSEQDLQLWFLADENGRLDGRRIWRNISELALLSAYEGFLVQTQKVLEGAIREHVKKPYSQEMAWMFVLGMVGGFAQWRSQTVALTLDPPACADSVSYGLSSQRIAEEVVSYLREKRDLVLASREIAGGQHRGTPDFPLAAPVIEQLVRSQIKIVEDLVAVRTAETPQSVSSGSNSGLPIVNLLLEDLKGLKASWL